MGVGVQEGWGQEGLKFPELLAKCASCREKKSNQDENLSGRGERRAKQLFLIIRTKRTC